MDTLRALLDTLRTHGSSYAVVFFIGMLVGILMEEAKSRRLK